MTPCRPADPRYVGVMTDKKKAASLKAAGATQKISKEDLADLLKRAEADDPEADENEPLPARGTPKADAKPQPKKK